MKLKKKLTIALIIILAANALLLTTLATLLLWDPADTLILRDVHGAYGTYIAEEAELEEVDFSFESIEFALMDINVTLNKSGEKHVVETKMIGVNGTKMFFDFDYGGVDYTVSLERKSNDFKLIGEVDCDYLECVLRKQTPQGKIRLGTFNVIK